MMWFVRWCDDYVGPFIHGSVLFLYILYLETKLNKQLYKQCLVRDGFTLLNND